MTPDQGWHLPGASEAPALHSTRTPRTYMSYSVAIVVNPAFGDEVLKLADRLHVWICSTVDNRAGSNQYQVSHPIYSLENGITTFTVGDQESSDSMLLRILPAVDEHHGEYSHVPPWDTLEIYGAALTPPVREALDALGVIRYTLTSYGFVCSRSAQGAI